MMSHDTQGVADSWDQNLKHHPSEVCTSFFMHTLVPALGSLLLTHVTVCLNPALEGQLPLPLLYPVS